MNPIKLRPDDLSITVDGQRAVPRMAKLGTPRSVSANGRTCHQGKERVGRSTSVPCLAYNY
jgi:hypothetical protein